MTEEQFLESKFQHLTHYTSDSRFGILVAKFPENHILPNFPSQKATQYLSNCIEFVCLMNRYCVIKVLRKSSRKPIPWFQRMFARIFGFNKSKDVVIPFCRGNLSVCGVSIKRQDFEEWGVAWSPEDKNHPDLQVEIDSQRQPNSIANSNIIAEGSQPPQSEMLESSELDRMEEIISVLANNQEQGRRLGEDELETLQRINEAESTCFRILKGLNAMRQSIAFGAIKMECESK